MTPKFEIQQAVIVDFCTMCDPGVAHDWVWVLRFNLGGQTYVFYLCDQHAQELQATLQTTLKPKVDQPPVHVQTVGRTLRQYSQKEGNQDMNQDMNQDIKTGYTVKKCPGEAHRPGSQADHCGVCMPIWGEIYICNNCGATMSVSTNARTFGRLTCKCGNKCKRGIS